MSLNAPIDDEQDRQAMAMLAAGQDSALDEFMDRYGERLYHFALRELQNESDAADVAEETFVRVYQNRQRYDPKHRVSTWLYTIATNLVRDRYRWRSRHPEVSANQTDASQEADWLARLPETAPTPGEKLEELERAAAVRAAVAALPEELKTPLILAEYEGFSHGQIAEVLACSAKAVEMRIYRARQHLRESLATVLTEA